VTSARSSSRFSQDPRSAIRTALLEQEESPVAVSLSQTGRLGPFRARKLQPHPWLAVALPVLPNLDTIIVLFQAYKIVRQTFARRSAGIGSDNAGRSTAWEHRLHLFIEPNLQSWAAFARVVDPRPELDPIPLHTHVLLLLHDWAHLRPGGVSSPMPRVSVFDAVGAAVVRDLPDGSAARHHGARVDRHAPAFWLGRGYRRHGGGCHSEPQRWPRRPWIDRRLDVFDRNGDRKS
jgi:hypothetical protein